MTSTRFACVSALTVLACVPTLGAQATAPSLAALDTTTTPSTCRTAARAYIDAIAGAHTTSGQLPTATQQATQQAALVAADREAYTRCVARFNRAALDGPQLLDVADLASSAGDDTLARALIARRLADSTLSTHDRAAALYQALRGAVWQYERRFYRDVGGDTAAAGPVAVALQRTVAQDIAQLKALGPAGAATTLLALSVAVGTGSASDSVVRVEAPTVVALATAVLQTDTAHASRRAAVLAVDGWVAALAKLGDAARGVALVGDVRTRLANAGVTLDSTADADLRYAQAKFAMVGRPAPPLAVNAWLTPTGAHRPPLARTASAYQGASLYTPRGAVTVIMFSTPDCVLCRLDYSTLKALSTSYRGRGVRFLIWTATALDGAKSLTAELANERRYFFGNYRLPMPIAVHVVGASQSRDDYWPSYHVAAIPVFVVLDATGVVRDPTDGWIKNRHPLPAVLDGLLMSARAGLDSSPGR